MNRSRRFVGFALMALLLLGVDLYSKWAIQEYLPHMRESAPYYPYGGIGVFPDIAGIEFSITHATNTGAVWGLFAEHLYLLLALRVTLIGGLIFYAFFGKFPKQTLLPLVLVILGASGNVFDVLLYGHVIDMLHFRFWGWQYPVFNFADAFIFIGVAWMLTLSLFQRKRRAESAS